jgi:hypothetical protein
MNNGSAACLKGLARISDARSCRMSSWDQSGRNKDYWLIGAGKTVTLAEIEGPGCINHIWMTSFCREIRGPSNQDPVLGAQVAPVTEMDPSIGVNYEYNDPEYYRKVLVRMTWENSLLPGVLVPLGDFFCIGHSMPHTFSSIPFNVSSRTKEECTPGGTAAMNCYFSMPFNKSAKIEIINENERPVGLFFHIDFELYRSPLEDIAYFHSCWHRESPCKGWGMDLAVNTPEVNSVANLEGKNNYVFLDIKGNGHYVGCNLSVIHYQHTWWGEGDDMIFIDGERIASIMGTGSEDYFGHAWGMQPCHSLYNGTIIHDSMVPGYQVSYRFHITDPVHFKRSIKVTMEHGHANHLSDDWASTAYWYQDVPFNEITIQPIQERLVFTTDKQALKMINIELNEDMQLAKSRYDSRNKVYREKFDQQRILNEARTGESSMGNIKAAKEVRKRFYAQ